MFHFIGTLIEESSQTLRKVQGGVYMLTKMTKKNDK